MQPLPDKTSTAVALRERIVAQRRSTLRLSVSELLGELGIAALDPGTADEVTDSLAAANLHSDPPLRHDLPLETFIRISVEEDEAITTPPADLAVTAAPTDQAATAPITEQRVDPFDAPITDANPVGLVISALGAATLIVSAFLPYASLPAGTFSTITNNTLLHAQLGWTVLVAAALVAADVVWMLIGWVPTRRWTLGKLLAALTVVLVLLILAITNNSLFRFYPIGINGQPNTSQPATAGSPASGFYVAFAGLAIAAFGLVLGRYAPGTTSRKICPDCAERVRRDARVCKHCGYRFG